MGKYLIGVLVGACLGLMMGILLAAFVPPRPDSCQARVSSAHMSLCLDSKIDKAMALFR